MQNQIPKNWQKVKLGSVIEIVDGDRGSKYPNGTDFTGNGYCLFLNTKNVPSTEFAFSKTDKQFISKEKDANLRKGKLKRGDFVLTTRGTVGNFAYYSDKIPYENMRINSGMVILRNNSNLLDSFYFKQYLISTSFRSQVIEFSSGSAQPQLPIKDLSQLLITVPPVLVQKKIASLLSAFDDKIELNNKIAKTLEEMAQAIFKEWFVNKKKNSWEIKQIRDIAKINKGISYSSKEISDSEGLPMINLANFLRGGGFNIEGIKLFTGKYKPSNLVRPGDIVIAMTDLTSNREVIGHPARVSSYSHWDKILVSLDVCSVETESIYVEFLYYLMLRKNFSYLMASSAGGTNVAHLSPKFIETYEFALPDKETLERFQLSVTPIFKKKNLIEMENQRLTNMRDMLLPKLMKGEIRV